MTSGDGKRSLRKVLREARQRSGLSLREVEKRTGIDNAHLSQLETGRISKPDPALVWDLAVLYDIDFDELLELSGRRGASHASAERPQQLTIALRVLGELTPDDQEAALRFMTELKQRRAGSGDE